MGVPWEERISERLTVVTSGGLWAGNTTLLHGRISGVRIRPASPGTRYDVTIVDRDNFVIYAREGVKGALVDDPAVAVPIRSILTISITNATANEAFFVKLMVEQ